MDEMKMSHNTIQYDLNKADFITRTAKQPSREFVEGSMAASLTTLATV
jgi:hypothetical protein